METMVLRSEREVEKLERSLFEIDREIEAVEAATKDLGVEEAKKKEEKTPLRDVKLRKQVAAKRVAGLREKRSKVEKELDTALEVSEVERRAFEREKKKKKDDAGREEDWWCSSGRTTTTTESGRPGRL